ncbi:hypothetical protein GM182_06410 [bacterium 3DAC]|jgi:predicted negative regulator of RcsB-dependent stress response|nr:hypothetical protein [Dictyoglomota bacterium]UZN23488.1 hypothetical protein GM182_06410 [bacterium 3DAC]
MAENENANGQETQEKKKDSPLVWLIILVINIALIFFMWNYYQKLKTQVVQETIGTATVTRTATTTVQEKAIVGYDLAEVLYDDLKTAHDQMLEQDFTTAQETLTHAVNVAGLTLKIISVESGNETIDAKLKEFRTQLSSVAYYLSQTLELLYKEQNDKAMAYFTKNIDLEKLKTMINDGKQYYIKLLIEASIKEE